MRYFVFKTSPRLDKMIISVRLYSIDTPNVQTFNTDIIYDTMRTIKWFIFEVQPYCKDHSWYSLGLLGWVPIYFLWNVILCFFLLVVSGFTHQLYENMVLLLYPFGCIRVGSFALLVSCGDRNWQCFPCLLFYLWLSV